MGAVAAPTLPGIRTTRLGAAAVLAAVTGWSFTNTLIKASSLPPLTFAAYRLWLGTVLLFGLLGLARQRPSRQAIRAAAPAGALFALEIAFFFSAVKQTTIADAAVISSLQPALVLLVAGPLFGERVTRRDLAWTAASLAGVLLVVVGSSGTPVWSLRGDLFAAGSLLCWTAYVLISKRARPQVSPLEYMAVVMAAASVVMTPMALLAGQGLSGIDARELLWLGVFVVGASTGHLLLVWAHAHVDVSVTSLLMLVQPVTASVAALAVLGEPLTVLEVVGALVVVGSLAAIVGRAARVGQAPAGAPPA